jgi:hypothetical protein
VRQVVVYFVGVDEAVFNVFLLTDDFDVIIFALVFTFLQEHLGAQLLQELVGLLQQLLNLQILGLTEELEILVHILALEGFEPGAGGLVIRVLLLFVEDFILVLGLVDPLLEVLLQFLVEFEKITVVDEELMDELLVLEPLPAFVLGLHLTLELLDAVSPLSIFGGPFGPEHPSIEEAFLD